MIEDKDGELNHNTVNGITTEKRTCDFLAKIDRDLLYLYYVTEWKDGKNIVSQENADEWLDSLGEIPQLYMVEKGDQIKFSENGITWRVYHRTTGEVLNAVVQLKSQNGFFKTYTNRDKRWNEEIIRV